MDITRKDLSKTKTKLTVTLGAKELDDAKQVALTKLAKNMKVEGFRKGKAPLGVVEKQADATQLQQQILEDAVSKAVAEAFSQKDVRALERPQVEVTKYVPGESVEFTAEAQMLPEVKLGDYKSLTAKKPAVSVPAKDVTDVIDNMRRNFAERTVVERAAKDGDEVVIDFVGKKDDVAFDGGSAKDYHLTLGSNSFIPGFEDAIVGHKSGEEFDIPLTFPKDYHVETMAGAKVIFTTTIKEIKEATLPKLDDEFAAKCGPFTSVDDLKADIKRELTERKEQEAQDTMRDELVDQLIKASTVPVPEILLNDQQSHIERDFQQNLMSQGATLDTYLQQKNTTKEDWLKNEVIPAAEKRVKAGLVLAELSKKEAIDASDEELAARVEQFRMQYASNPEVVKQITSPEGQREIANQLLTEKTIDHLVELNAKK